MPGQPTFSTANAYGDYPAPGAVAVSGGSSHNSFILWVILLGVVLPVAIIGGLKVGGYSFVFKGR
jgi:hypothetical protein